MQFDDWLSAGDVPEAEWSVHVVQLATRGELGRAAGGWLLDLPALAQPYGCDSGECTPGLRDRGTRSCCADLDVDLSGPELDAIDDALPEIAAHLAPRDRRWADGIPTWVEGDTLTRPGGRCVFATGSGLRCALHQVEDATDRPRGTLKPFGCRLFPLIVVSLDDETRLLSAVHRKTTRHVGLPSARSFPCLRDPSRVPLVQACRDTLTELFGEPTYTSMRRAVRQYRAVIEPS